MVKLENLSDSFAGQAAIVAGAASAAAGVVQIVHSERRAGTRVVGLAGHLTLSLFALSLVAMSPCFIALARRARPRIAQNAALAASTGTALLGITCLTSVINGQDLAIFPAVAGLTNLAWLAGSVIIAVSLRRAGTVSTAAAVGLPLTWLFSIPLSTLGGNLLAAAYLLTVGYLLANNLVERPLAQVPAASHI